MIYLLLYEGVVMINNNKKNDIDKVILLVVIFFVGSFIGYIYEVIFYKFTEGVIANRGSLYGPCLPIYGTGAICIYYLRNLKKHPVTLFLLLMLITGILEYLVGYFILNIEGIRLWDYRGLFLNIQGLVCLRSVISFAIMGLGLIYIILPILYKYLPRVSYNRQETICSILLIILAFDIIVSTMFRSPITY